MNPRNPTDENRILILGRTGSGKTVFAFNILSTRNWNEIPWVIIDYKKDKLFTKLLKLFKGNVRKLDVDDKPPKRPGLYVMRPTIGDDDAAMAEFLGECYEKGDIGLYLDEGYAIPQKLLDIILTQGRSLRIPVIVLYQRPVWMTKFATSQADFIAVFHIKEFNDRKHINEMIGDVVLPDGTEIKASQRLKKYHCLWHDVGADESYILNPAPSEDVIFEVFRQRLGLGNKARRMM